MIEADVSIANQPTFRGLPVSNPTASAASVLPVPGGPWNRHVVPVRSVRKPHCPISTARAFSCCTTCDRKCMGLCGGIGICLLQACACTVRLESKRSAWWNALAIAHAKQMSMNKRHADQRLTLLSLEVRSGGSSTSSSPRVGTRLRHM